MNSVTKLIERVKSGNDSAAADLWNRYHMRLTALARKKLGDAPRRTLDEEDVVVQAFASFCRRAEDGCFPDLRDRDDLWKLLITICERKAINQRKHLFRKKNAIVGESALPDADGCGGIGEYSDDSPSPEFAVIVADEVAAILQSLPSAAMRRVCILKMEGLTNKEVAASMGCSCSSVERKLRIVRAHLKAREGGS